MQTCRRLRNPDFRASAMANPNENLAVEKHKQTATSESSINEIS